MAMTDEPSESMDCIGLYCPAPILQLREKIDEMPLGAVLEVLADDPAAEECIVVVSLDKRGRSRLLVCPYERHPRLEGLEVEFKGVKEFSGGGEAYLLQAFFEGVAAAASKQGWREP